MLFLEPPLSLLSPFRDQYLDWRQVFNLGRLKYRGRHLYSYCPVKFLPSQIPGVAGAKCDELNRRYAFGAVRGAARRLGIRRPILWINFSMSQYDYQPVFQEVLRVTDYYDKFTAGFGWTPSPEYHRQIVERHTRIIAQADVVFTATQELLEDARQLNPASYHVPHGVDVKSFAGPRITQGKLGRTLRRIPRPILGYLGAVQHKLDFGLLEYVAQTRPAWSLVLVGRVAINNARDWEDWARLKRLRNVWHFDEVKRGLIPAVLDCFDVCLIPFKRIEFTSYGGSLKVWEYFASGKPIVAVNLDSEYGCNRALQVADDPPGFVRAVDELLEPGQDPRLAEERMALARAASWDARVEAMMRIVEFHLAAEKRTAP